NWIQRPDGAQWNFARDGYGNLTTITSPATVDQTSGITVTLNWDASNRLSSITDGNGHTGTSYTYVSGTKTISKVTINDNDVTYGYGTGLTSRTDRNGIVHRYLFSGSNLIQTDL